MENQKQSSGSYFGPRLRMPTRSKAASGSRRRHKSRFRSQRMNEIVKDMEKWKAYMLPNTRNRNDRSGVGVTSNAHMRNGKQACGSDKKDQRGNIVSPQAERVPPVESRAGQSSNVLLVKKNCLIPLVDIKSSNPSGVKNVLPSKELENPTPLLSKDGSNTKLRYQKLSHFGNRTSHPIDAEVMTKLAHRAKNNDASKNEDGTLASKSNDRSSHTQGQDINVKMHIKEISKILASERDEKETEVETRRFGNDLSRHHAYKKRKKEEEKLRTCDSDDSTRVVQQNKLTSRSIKRRRYIPSNEEDEDEVGACDKNMMSVDASIGVTQATSRSIKRRRYIPSNEEDEDEVGACDKNMMSVDASIGLTQATSRSIKRRRYIPSNEEDEDEVGASDKNLMSVDASIGLTQATSRSIKRRRYIPSNEEDEDEVGACDKNLMSVDARIGLTQATSRSIKRRYIPSNEEDGDEVGAYDKNLMSVDASIGLTQATILNDYVERQCDNCLKPINEPAWGGIFKIDGKEYISLVGHLSTKSCEKVWKLSKSLPPVVQVEMVPRLIVWPRIWRTSKPSGDNIGLYFLPCNMRHDEELDQLVNEVMKNDLVLRAIINEAEMLIFPSVLLPKRYQMFQAKHYLWAAFMPREDKGVVLAEPLDCTGNHQIKE